MSGLGGFTTFNQSGKLVQIENALAAVQNGNLSIGCKAQNGVVLVSNATQPTPLFPPTEKMEKVHKNCGLIYAGMSTDFTQLVRLARKKAGAYYLQYGEHMPVKQIASALGREMQTATQRGGVRPYGCSVLLSGYDHDGFKLYQIQPSGVYQSWKASAVGKNQGNANDFLEKRYDDELELEDAVHTCLLTLKESFEGEMTSEKINVSYVSEDGFKILNDDEKQDYLQELA